MAATKLVMNEADEDMGGDKMSAERISYAREFTAATAEEEEEEEVEEQDTMSTIDTITITTTISIPTCAMLADDFSTCFPAQTAANSSTPPPKKKKLPKIFRFSHQIHKEISQLLRESAQ